MIEVAIVRPGPIQGGMVHPYLQRRECAGRGRRIRAKRCDAILEKTLRRSDLSGTGDADRHRRRRTSRRAKPTSCGARWAHGIAAARWSVQEKLHGGHAARMATRREFAEQIYKQIEGFGEYGFPESHSASFACSPTFAAG